MAHSPEKKLKSGNEVAMPPNFRGR